MCFVMHFMGSGLVELVPSLCVLQLQAEPQLQLQLQRYSTLGQIVIAALLLLLLLVMIIFRLSKGNSL